MSEPNARRGRALLVVAALLPLAGCASAAHRRAPAMPLTPAAHAWELPSGAFPTQRIYQGSYNGPEGSGSFRATLRLVAADRFRLDASDRLGRLFWSAGEDGARGWWIDHRTETWCDDLASLALPGLGAGPVSGVALPALLLGVVPATPVGSPAVDGHELVLHDAAGRRWSATLDDSGRVLAWTLFARDEPVWWWRRQGRGGVLSQRQGEARPGRQLEWQEVVAEPLGTALAAFTPPAGYARSCDAGGDTGS
jgi:hypothetical protein